LQATLDGLQELGFRKAHIDARAHSDLSLVEEAAKCPRG
jgi:hypothetical protein